METIDCNGGRIAIPHISKTKLGLYASLSNAKMRRRHGLFVAEGEKCVTDLARYYIPEAFLIEDKVDLPEGWEQENRAPVYRISASEMGKISSFSTPSPFAGIFHIPADLPMDYNIVGGELYLVVDGVRDPGNMGTIIRTCHWFGIRRIFASRDSVDIYNPKSIQSSMGSLGGVKIVYCDLESLFAANPGIPVCGLLLEGENIYRSELPRSAFIVMGNEGQGISEAIRSLITCPLTIPPHCEDHSESLNVAIATAVTLALFRRSQ